MSGFRVTRKPTPSPVQRAWLVRGLNQPGGKLPLFDRAGQQMDPRTVQACIEQGWAAPWFNNPLKPDWLVCRLTDEGRQAVAGRRAQRPVVAAEPAVATMAQIRHDILRTR
jgi:hypothetical protein